MEGPFTGSKEDNVDKSKSNIGMRMACIALSVAAAWILLEGALNHIHIAVQLGPPEYTRSLVESEIFNIKLIFLLMLLVALLGWGSYLYKYFIERSA